MTCAAGATSGLVDPENEMWIPAEATHEMVVATYARAARRAVESGKPVFVHFEP